MKFSMIFFMSLKLVSVGEISDLQYLGNLFIFIFNDLLKMIYLICFIYNSDINIFQTIKQTFKSLIPLLLPTNAVRNMRKIVEELVKTGKRPINFQRKKATAPEKKESELGGRVVRQAEKCVAYGESQQKSKDTKNNKNNIKSRKVVKNIGKVIKKVSNGLN